MTEEEITKRQKKAFEEAILAVGEAFSDQDVLHGVNLFYWNDMTVEEVEEYARNIITSYLVK